jgi:hypothetical protein
VARTHWGLPLPVRYYEAKEVFALATADVVERLERGEAVRGILPPHYGVGAMCETVAYYLRRRNLEVRRRAVPGCVDALSLVAALRFVAVLLANVHMRLYLRAVQRLELVRATQAQ